jgi:hypothetical protein
MKVWIFRYSEASALELSSKNMRVERSIPKLWSCPPSWGLEAYCAQGLVRQELRHPDCADKVVLSPAFSPYPSPPRGQPNPAKNKPTDSDLDRLEAPGEQQQEREGEGDVACDFHPPQPQSQQVLI